MKIYKIYKITKPSEPLSIYIGRTVQTLKERLRQHFKEQKIHQEWLIYTWLDNTCEIELIEETEDKSLEDFHIKYYKSLNYNLYNTRNGDNNLTDKEWRQQYYLNNRDKKIKSSIANRKKDPNYKEKAKEYYNNNKEKILEKKKLYYLNKKLL